MNKLLRFEFHKLIRQKSMRVCSIVLVCLLLLSLLTTNSLWNSGTAEITGYAMPTASSLAVSALSSCSFTLILAIFTALFVSEDSSEGTLKNIYSKGYKRSDVFLSKIIAVSVYCIIMAVICIVFAYVGGMILFPNNRIQQISELFPLIPQITIMLAYTALYGLIASASQKSGNAIAGCIVAPMLAALVIGMVDTFLNFDTFKFSSYWLDNMYSAVNSTSAAQSSMLIGIIGSLLYIAVLLFAGIYISNKKQV